MGAAAVQGASQADIVLWASFWRVQYLQVHIPPSNAMFPQLAVIGPGYVHPCSMQVNAGAITKLTSA